MSAVSSLQFHPLHELLVNMKFSMHLSLPLIVAFWTLSQVVIVSGSPIGPLESRSIPSYSVLIVISVSPSTFDEMTLRDGVDVPGNVKRAGIQEDHDLQGRSLFFVAYADDDDDEEQGKVPDA
ncbi:hypothetical protein C8R44DRAFT_987076 [Mycena epipterygia]|nr:hypothetical protein C8R44DRAFT_987074 [Mycena epipterygia]KAJ7107561.1 hypothetical protein C8R44DRAFT_987076 [Mycena epipterygia]